MNKFLIALLFPVYCLAQIPAYYNTIDFSQTGNTLKNQLSTLITTTHTNELTYTPEVWDALKQSDLDPDNANNVFLIYGYNDTDSNNDNDRTRNKNLSCHTTSCDGLWVREHVFPRSLGTPNLEYVGPGADAHHLRAIDSDMNNDRGNNRFADGSGNAAVITGGYFYPGDEWKGDVARMMMYMYLRYPTQCQAVIVGSGSATFSADMPNIFLEWNEEDPVSQYEMNRNTVLQNMQGNRNPFIDNPYLATRIWNGPEAEDKWGLLSNEDFVAENITLYPTLTTGIVYINNVQEAKSYTVYNNVGQLIKSELTQNSIDLTNYAAGLYFIKISNEYSGKTFRVIKQ
ncbi:endonuclease [Flavobacterium sp. AG291]|uniref:endonuclease n=1 Tax=Flavobacterium sp. AG291 TaxID=2184000 RepID=UPI000E0C7802|nr:endonuclease [Flavobacterium sp. AG291]RDI04482.1 putative secreted protein (Por secretion system target) [Flavobacterium sp. AG291]